MDNKKAIQTLIKIAQNQQKIINKLAQQAGMPVPQAQPMSGGTDSNWEDVSDAVAPTVQQANPQFSVASARIGKLSGTLDLRIQHPKNIDDATYRAGTGKIKAAFMGKPMGPSGTKVQSVEITGEMV